MKWDLPCFTSLFVKSGINLELGKFPFIRNAGFFWCNFNPSDSIFELKIEQKLGSAILLDQFYNPEKERNITL